MSYFAGDEGKHSRPCMKISWISEYTLTTALLYLTMVIIEGYIETNSRTSKNSVLAAPPGLFKVLISLGQPLLIFLPVQVLSRYIYSPNHYVYLGNTSSVKITDFSVVLLICISPEHSSMLTIS